MSNLVEHAKVELEMAGLFSEDSDYDGMLGDGVLELIKVFSDQGHSGASAAITSNLFDRLSRYKPLGPLTGKDEEWVEVHEGTLQNKRCSHVFKEGRKAHTIQGIIFRERSGAAFTGFGSRQYLTFPCTPKSKTVPAYLHWIYKLRSRIQRRIYA